MFIPILFPNVDHCEGDSECLKAVDQTVRGREYGSTFISSSKCKTIQIMLLTSSKYISRDLIYMSLQSDGERKRSGKSYSDTIVLTCEDKALSNTVQWQNPSLSEGLDQKTPRDPFCDSN